MTVFACRYPSLQDVVVHGNGLGGKACMLYAACNSVDQSSRDLRDGAVKVRLRYFPAGADSYLYLRYFFYKICTYIYIIISAPIRVPSHG